MIGVETWITSFSPFLHFFIVGHVPLICGRQSIKCVWEWVCWPQSKQWWCAHKVPGDGGLCLPDPGVQRAALLPRRLYTMVPLYPYTGKEMQSLLTISTLTLCINAPCKSYTLQASYYTFYFTNVQRFGSTGVLPPQLKKQALHVDLATKLLGLEIWHESLSEA